MLKRGNKNTSRSTKSVLSPENKILPKSLLCFSLGIIWDLHNFKACGPLKIGKNILREDGSSKIFKFEAEHNFDCFGSYDHLTRNGTNLRYTRERREAPQIINTQTGPASWNSLLHNNKVSTNTVIYNFQLKKLLSIYKKYICNNPFDALFSFHFFQL